MIHSGGFATSVVFSFVYDMHTRSIKTHLYNNYTLNTTILYLLLFFFFNCENDVSLKRMCKWPQAALAI